METRNGLTPIDGYFLCVVWTSSGRTLPWCADGYWPLASMRTAGRQILPVHVPAQSTYECI